MQIEIKIDETLSEPRIIIMTNKITDEISELMQRLAEEKPRSPCRLQKGDSLSAGARKNNPHLCGKQQGFRRDRRR